MKRLHDLTLSDLELSPVWRYDGETDDVAVLHATDYQALSGSTTEVYLARTQFVLANGSQFIGFCTPGDDAGVGHLQPAIVTPGGLVFFWFDQPPTEESLEKQWQHLGASAEEIFPVHFRCTVPLDGHFVTGTIEQDDLKGAA